MNGIDDKTAAKLLKIWWNNKERLEQLEELGVKISGLDCEEIVEVILDALGFPTDTSTNINLPDPDSPVFCRDPLIDVLFDTVTEGTDQEFEKVIHEWKEMAKEITSLYWSDNKHH